MGRMYFSGYPDINYAMERENNNQLERREGLGFVPL
jgi:hypothetical protein